MRSLRRPRTALIVALLALACTGGSFTCSGDSGDDDGDKVVVDTRVNT